MFFNSKRFEIVDLNAQQVLELNKLNTLSFYIKDVFLDTAVSTIHYLPIKKSGRDELPIGSYVSIDDITGDVIKFNYTPTDATAQSISFRIKVTDIDESVHLLNIDTYSVIA